MITLNDAVLRNVIGVLLCMYCMEAFPFLLICLQESLLSRCIKKKKHVTITGYNLLGKKIPKTTKYILRSLCGDLTVNLCDIFGLKYFFK